MQKFVCNVDMKQSLFLNYVLVYFFNEKYIRILLVVDFQVCYTKSKKILKLSLDFSFGVFIYFYYQN